jgi:hypothetical protein
LPYSGCLLPVYPLLAQIIVLFPCCLSFTALHELLPPGICKQGICKQGQCRKHADLAPPHEIQCDVGGSYTLDTPSNPACLEMYKDIHTLWKVQARTVQLTRMTARLYSACRIKRNNMPSRSTFPVLRQKNQTNTQDVFRVRLIRGAGLP